MAGRPPMSVRQRRESMIARFVEKIEFRLGDGDECWLWRAATSKSGYGRFGVSDGETEQAHRVSFSLAYRVKLRGDVLHRCDNPPCVRPSHLYEGNSSLNSADALNSLRALSGERSHFSKLTDDEARLVFVMREDGLLLREIASRLMVSEATVSRILGRKKWRFLDVREMPRLRQKGYREADQHLLDLSSRSRRQEQVGPRLER